MEFAPRVLRDVSAVDPSTTLLGARSALPLVFAPTGFTRLMHTEGERAVGRVAERRRHPLRAVDDGHDLDRGAGGGGARAAGGGSSSTSGATGRPSAALVERAARGGLRGAGADRRHARWPARGCATSATGSPIPPTLTAADGRQRRRCTRAGGSTCSPPSRWSSPRCARGAAPSPTSSTSVFEPTVTLDDVAALRASLAGRAGRQGHPDRRRRPRGRRRRGRRGRRLATTAAASSTARRRRWSSCPRSSRRSATGPRCTWTAASSTAPTWSPRSRSAPGLPGRPGLPLRAHGRRRAGRAAGRRHPDREIARTHAAARRRVGRRADAGPRPAAP